MNVTAVQCLAFEWTCPDCGDVYLCRQEDLGSKTPCFSCRQEITITALHFDNGAMMAVPVERTIAG